MTTEQSCFFFLDHCGFKVSLCDTGILWHCFWSTTEHQDPAVHARLAPSCCGYFSLVQPHPRGDLVSCHLNPQRVCFRWLITIPLHAGSKEISHPRDLCHSKIKLHPSFDSSLGKADLLILRHRLWWVVSHVQADIIFTIFSRGPIPSGYKPLRSWGVLWYASSDSTVDEFRRSEAPSKMHSGAGLSGYDQHVASRDVPII